MELTGDLKKRVEQAETREETKKIIEGAGAEAISIGGNEYGINGKTERAG